MTTRRPPGFAEESAESGFKSDSRMADAEAARGQPWPKPRRRVTSAELVRNFGQLSDLALTEPLHITRNGRERLVLISDEEYQRLTHGERVVRKTEDTPEELMAHLEATQMDPKHDHLNDELKDWKP